MQLGTILWFIPIVFLLLLFPLLYTTIPEEYFSHLLFEFLFFWGGYWIGIIFRKRFKIKWKKAKLSELKTEDSVLLEGIGIFQGTLFIYLELVKITDIYTVSLKWSIPIVTGLFFILRGYGAIKNKPRHRFWSSMLLINYLELQLLFLLRLITARYFIIYVGSTNIVDTYFPYLYILLLGTFFMKIWNALAIRYGHQ